MANDLAQFVAETLKGSEAVCACVMDGADGILETGDTSVIKLADRQAQRRETGNPPKVLAITVQDAGERASDEMTTEQKVGIWIWDRERGYGNIRLATKAIYAALEGLSTPLTSPLTNRTVAVIIQFERRSGHLMERSMEVDVEYISFKAIVKKDLG